MPYKDYQTHLRKERERYQADAEYRERKKVAARRNYTTDKKHANHIERTYGISQNEYDILVAKQEGKCALCNSIPAISKRFKYTLQVDHDHVTGKVRGLLCFYCNKSLGWYEKRKELINNYIENREKKTI